MKTPSLLCKGKTPNSPPSEENNKSSNTTFLLHSLPLSASSAGDQGGRHSCTTNQELYQSLHHHFWGVPCSLWCVWMCASYTDVHPPAALHLSLSPMLIVQVTSTFLGSLYLSSPHGATSMYSYTCTGGLGFKRGHHACPTSTLSHWAMAPTPVTFLLSKVGIIDVPHYSASDGWGLLEKPKGPAATWVLFSGCPFWSVFQVEFCFTCRQPGNRLTEMTHDEHAWPRLR